MKVGTLVMTDCATSNAFKQLCKDGETMLVFDVAAQGDAHNYISIYVGTEVLKYKGVYDIIMLPDGRIRYIHPQGKLIEQ